MATIPDASSLGGRPSLRTNRPVTQNTSAATQANAFTDFGEAAFRSGAAVQDKQDTFAINMANQDYLQLDDKVRREVQELDDYSTWDEEYKNRMAVGLEPIVSGVRGNQNQELFRERAASTVSQGSGIMFDAAFKREAIKGQADAFNALTATKETFLTTSDPRLRTTYLNHAHEIIKSSLENGYIDDAQAAQAREELSQVYGIGWVGMQDTKTQLASVTAALDAKTGGNAMTSIPGIPHSDTVLKHSQDMINSGKARQNENGTGSTFVGTVVNWDELNGGRATIIPSYIDGKQYNYKLKADRDAAMPYLTSKTWPSADSVKEAEAMEQTIHDEMAKQGATGSSGTPADIIHVDKLKAMKDALTKANEEEDSLAEAYALKDAGYNSSASLAENMKIGKKASNPKTRATVEAMIKEAYSQDGIASKELMNQYVDDILKRPAGTDGAMTKADLLKNTEAMGILRREDQEIIFDLLDAQAEGKKPVHNVELWWAFQDMDKETLAKQNPMNHVNALDRQHLEALGNMIKDAQNPDPTKWVRGRALTTKMTDAVGGAPGRRSDSADRFFSMVEAELQSLPEEARTPAEEDRIIARAKVDVFIKERNIPLTIASLGMMGSPEEYRLFELEHGENFGMKYDKIPPGDLRDVMADFAEMEIFSPTKEQVVGWYVNEYLKQGARSGK